MIMAKRKSKNKGKKVLVKASKAETADRHVLYENSVQNTETEYEFIDGVFRKLRKRKAFTLREDFCGTASMCCEWVQQRRKNKAFGVDLDEDVLAWGKFNNVNKLKPAQQQRVELIQGDVMRVKMDPVDVTIAMNFSYQIFKTRALLRKYFKRGHASLVDDGLFILDVFGGYEAYQELEEETEHDHFTYIWDQAKYNPVNGDITCHIHFSFPDQSRMEKAFTYEWRLWTLPELKELLVEAGFSKITLYCQESDDDDESVGDFLPVTEMDADAGWIAFIVAEK